MPSAHRRQQSVDVPETLSLHFGHLRGATTKSRRTRVVPIGTARLLAVLEWLRLDSAGERKDEEVPVFSNEAREPLKTFKKAWVVAVLKAHGVDPHWRKGAYKDLSTECQQRFRSINLHWHDLRHEYARGKTFDPRIEAADNLSAEAVSRASAKAEVSRIFQDPAEQSFAGREDPAKKSAISH